MTSLALLSFLAARATSSEVGRQFFTPVSAAPSWCIHPLAQDGPPKIKSGDLEQAFNECSAAPSCSALQIYNSTSFALVNYSLSYDEVTCIHPDRLGCIPPSRGSSTLRCYLRRTDYPDMYPLQCVPLQTEMSTEFSDAMLACGRSVVSCDGLADEDVALAMLNLDLENPLTNCVQTCLFTLSSNQNKDPFVWNATGSCWDDSLSSASCDAARLLADIRSRSFCPDHTLAEKNRQEPVRAITCDTATSRFITLDCDSAGGGRQSDCNNLNKTCVDSRQCTLFNSYTAPFEPVSCWAGSYCYPYESSTGRSCRSLSSSVLNATFQAYFIEDAEDEYFNVETAIWDSEFYKIYRDQASGWFVVEKETPGLATTVAQLLDTQGRLRYKTRGLMNVQEAEIFQIVDGVVDSPPPVGFYNCTEECHGCADQVECLASDSCRWTGAMCLLSCAGGHCPSCAISECDHEACQVVTNLQGQFCSEKVVPSCDVNNCQLCSAEECDSVHSGLLRCRLSTLSTDAVCLAERSRCASGVCFNCEAENECAWAGDICMWVADSCRPNVLDSQQIDLKLVCEPNIFGECKECVTGQYCPESTIANATTSNICPDDFICPAPTDLLPCPAGFICKSGQLFPCREGLYCAPGGENTTVAASSCPAGYYCPDSSRMILCPEGHWCTEYMTSPVPCAFIAICPAGSSTQRLGVIPYLLFLTVLISAGFTVAVYKSAKAAKRHGLSRSRTVAGKSKHAALMVAAESNRLHNAFRGLQPLDVLAPIEFKGLGMTLKSNPAKRILKGVTGSFQHSSLHAIMGPSGSGKTTFLNALSGKAYYGNVEGTLNIAGESASIPDIRTEVGFVPQDDIVHELLTVQENFMFNARLRLPATTSKELKNKIVLDVLDILELDHIADSIVGSVEKRGISGGQRKRVNIGLELVANPTILFLDEPTSGLDATTTLEVLVNLRVMSRLGMTIVCVLHQPRYAAFLCFDSLLLLGVGGVTVYLGPSQSALGYFTGLGFELPAGENPADFFLDIIAGQHQQQGQAECSEEEMASMLPDLWLQHHGTVAKCSRRHSIADAKQQSKLNNRVVPGFGVQYVRFLLREVKVLYVMRASFLLNTLLVATPACLLGAIYGASFTRTSDLAQIGMIGGIIFGLFMVLLAFQNFARDHLLNQREAQSGLNQHAYFMAKLTMDLLFCGWYSFAWTFPYYTLLCFWMPAGFPTLLLYTFLSALVTSGYGIAWSLFTASQIPGGVSVSAMGLFFGGFMIPLSTFGSFEILKYICWVRWYVLAQLHFEFQVVMDNNNWVILYDIVKSSFEIADGEAEMGWKVMLIVACVTRVLCWLVFALQRKYPPGTIKDKLNCCKKQSVPTSPSPCRADSDSVIVVEMTQENPSAVHETQVQEIQHSKDNADAEAPEGASKDEHEERAQGSDDETEDKDKNDEIHAGDGVDESVLDGKNSEAPDVADEKMIGDEENDDGDQAGEKVIGDQESSQEHGGDVDDENCLTAEMLQRAGRTATDKRPEAQAEEETQGE